MEAMEAAQHIVDKDEGWVLFGSARDSKLKSLNLDPVEVKTLANLIRNGEIEPYDYSNSPSDEEEKKERKSLQALRMEEIRKKFEEKIRANVSTEEEEEEEDVPVVVQTQLTEILTGVKAPTKEEVAEEIKKETETKELAAKAIENYKKEKELEKKKEEVKDTTPKFVNHYTIKKGETLKQIADANSMTVIELMKKNKIKKVTDIKPGQNIIL